MDMDEPEVALLSEQMRHALDLSRAESEALRAELAHYRALTDHRLSTLEAARDDHETRLRAAIAGVTEFKLFSGLAIGGSGLMSLFALIRVLLGQ
jgi:hypothetical protein